MILFVSGEYPPDVGGLGDYTHQLRSSLAALGWQSDILSRRHVRRWNVRSLLTLLRMTPRTSIVHIQFQAGAYDLLGDVCLMPMLLRCLRPAVRTVTTFHDVRLPYLFPRAGALRPAATRFLARTSDAVIAADERDLHVLGGPSTRHHHVPIGPNIRCEPPPGYNRGAFRARLGLDPADLAVVYFGLLNASKGLDLLFAAFNLILAQCPRAQLLLLGGQVGASDPTDRRTFGSIQPELERLRDRVVQPGWLAPNALSAYLLAGDVALLPYTDGASARRGSLLACAEHGLPIVSTQPAAAEVAPFVEAIDADARALAQAILQVRAGPARLRAASRNLAAQVSWRCIARDHVAIYQSLTGSRS